MLRNVLRSIVVNVPVEQAYAIWQDFASYPKFLSHVQELRVQGRQMFWKVMQGGVHRQWVFQVVEMTAPHRIAWHACDGRHHRTVVTLKPLARDRTEVSLGAEYDAPAGGRDDKGERFEHYLDRFKMLAETGDVFEAAFAATDESVPREALL